MPIDRSHAGRQYPPVEFAVEAGAIAAFADAIGDPSPLFRDLEAARAAGYEAQIAPPTFSARTMIAAAQLAAADPDLGLHWDTVLHGEQELEWIEPLVAGRRYSAATRIVDIRGREPLEFITLETLVTGPEGRVAVRGHTTLIAQAGGR